MLTGVLLETPLGLPTRRVDGWSVGGSRARVIACVCPISDDVVTNDVIVVTFVDVIVVVVVVLVVVVVVIICCEP